MKQLAIAAIAASLLLFASPSTSQEKQKESTDQQKQMRMTEMMKDSSMMNMMMDRIASDEHMRMTMMHKMMNSTRSDTACMMEMCKEMMGDKDMRSCMRKVGMMKHEGTMHDKSSDTKTDAEKKSEQEEHHKQDQ